MSLSLNADKLFSHFLLLVMSNDGFLVANVLLWI